MTHRRHLTAALALLAVLGVALVPRAAAASKADAFEGKIQPVSGQLFRKAGRLELTVGTGLSLNDAFFNKYMGDVKLGFHLTESLSASVHASMGIAVATDSTTVCPTGEACRDATDPELWQVPGKISRILGAEFAWSPIYGKLNVFSEKVAHIDLSIMAGADFISHAEVLSTADAAAYELAGDEPAEVMAPAFHAGIGMRIFLSEAFAVRLDLRDYVYWATVPNGDKDEIQNQLMTEIGVSVFFPFSNRRQP